MFRPQIFLFYLLLIGISVGQINAQKNNFPKYRFDPLTYNVTERAVACIAQDQDGFIWMGTNGLGISRFNGRDYNSYKFVKDDSTSLSNSLVHTIHVDKDNIIWVGTESGLDIYNREQDNFNHIALDHGQNKLAISVQAILEQDDNTLLVGTHQQGLFSVDRSSGQSVRIKISDVENLSNLLINSLSLFDNRIVLGTNIGLLEFDTKKHSIIPLNFTTTKGREEFSAATKTMLVDDKGTIWLGTNNQGLYKIDDNENGRYQIEHFPITSKRILSLLSTPRNTFLCGTENDGMFEMDYEGNIINHYLKDKFDDKGIKSNSIWSLFLDNRERIWMGYYNNGVAIYDRFYDKFPDLVSKPYNTNSLQSSSVTDILQDDKGRFWIGMDGGGIDIYEPVLNTFTHLLDSKNEIANGLDAPNVQTIFKDSKKNIWVGTWDNGIYLLKNGTQQFIHYTVESTNSSLTSDRIINFSEDATGTIWIATFSGGLQSFDPRYNNFTNYRNEPFLSQNLSYSDIRKIYVDSEDNLWIASNAGLFRLLLTGSGFGLENLTGRLYNSRENTGYKSLIIDIYEDSEKNIWLGTASAGLFKYNMVSDEFETINTKSGFDKVTVSSLIEDESGDLWAAGNNGITRIDQEKNIIKNFSESDGLLANDFNSHAAYKDKEGKLWFGSYNGVNFFDPEDLASNKTTPSVYLTDLKIFNKTVEPNNERSPLSKVISQTSSLSLSHEKSVFTIDYAAIDFTRPEKIQFAYYLDGFEEDYNYVQNTRSATYTNLPSGSYTFKVKASNSDGLWSETPTILNIEILRPWWLTNIAIIVYFFVLALVSYVIYWYLLKRIKARRAIENEREKHNQEEALNTKKIQFFTNISHEFRTPLTLILSPLEDILSETGLSEKIKEKHRIIYKNTDRLKRLIDELMDFRKLQLNKLPLYVTSFDINDLASDVLDHFKEEAQQRNIVIAFEGADLREPIWADKNKLEKVIFNILSNAFKSTGNNGIITLKLNEKEHKFKADDRISDAMEISIEDTGKGIPSEELNKIFDRFYQIKDRNEQYFNGTGIGLELVKSFVELHHGEIQVQSEIDVGTLFKIIIPIQNDDHSETKGNESSGHNELSNDNKNIGQREIERTINEGKRTVLIVEDNIELNDYIARELKDVYHIYTSENGIDGFEQAQKYIPDVIITDVIMPGMNGHEFCDKIKTTLSTSHIPVLMLTAKAMADDWVEGLEAGADAYLTKPFKMKVIRSQVKQLITNRELLYSKYLGAIEKNTPEEKISSFDQQFILNVMAHIQKNLGEPDLNVEKLADEFNLSRSQLYRKIKALTGNTANELIRNARLERSKELIEASGNLAISEISFKVGFSSPSYFSKCFKEYFDMLPTEVNKK